MVYKIVNGAVPSGTEWMSNSVVALKANGHNMVRTLLNSNSATIVGIGSGDGIYTEDSFVAGGVLKTLNETNSTAGVGQYTRTASNVSEGIVEYDVPAGTFSDTISTAFGTSLSEYGDISTRPYYRTKFTVQTLMNTFGNNVEKFCFSSDGSNMYVWDNGSGEVRQIELAVPFDFYYSANTYINGYDPVHFGQATGGLRISDDGTLITFCEGTQFYKYTLSTPFDLSTISYTATKNLNAENTSIYSFCFGNDGTKLYTSDDTSDTVYQYSLSTAYDVSTATYDSKSFSIDAFSKYIYVSEDGTLLYHFTGSTNKTFYRRVLSTPFDISTAGAKTNVMGAVSGKTPTDLFFIKGEGAFYFIYTDGSGNEYLTTVSVKEREDGDSIQFKLKNATEDTGWMDVNEVQSFTPFTSEPTTVQFKLIPRSTNPSAGVPAIKGVAVFE